MVRVLVLGLVIGLVGCAQETPPPAQPEAQQSTQVTGTGGSGGSGDGIAPMTPSVAPNAPVMGTDSVQGASAGGVQQSAKDAAKRAAGKAGGGSTDQMPSEGE